MTSREEFEAWYVELEPHTEFDYDSPEKNFSWWAWQARGELDAKRIAELEAKLAIAIEALEDIESGFIEYREVAAEALTKIKG